MDFAARSESQHPKSKVEQSSRDVKFTFSVFFARGFGCFMAFKSLLRKENHGEPDVNSRAVNVNFGEVNWLLVVS